MSQIFGINDFLVTIDRKDNFNYTIEFVEDSDEVARRKVFYINTTSDLSLRQFIYELTEFLEGKR